MRILTITLKYTLHRYRYVANCIQYRVIVAVFNLKKSGNWLENLENKYSTKKQLLGWRQVLLKLWILVRWLIFKFIWRYCSKDTSKPSLEILSASCLNFAVVFGWSLNYIHTYIHFTYYIIHVHVLHTYMNM